MGGGERYERMGEEEEEEEEEERRRREVSRRAQNRTEEMFQLDT